MHRRLHCRCFSWIDLRRRHHHPESGYINVNSSQRDSSGSSFICSPNEFRSVARDTTDLYRNACCSATYCLRFSDEIAILASCTVGARTDNCLEGGDAIADRAAAPAPNTSNWWQQQQPRSPSHHPPANSYTSTARPASPSPATQFATPLPGGSWVPARVVAVVTSPRRLHGQQAHLGLFARNQLGRVYSFEPLAAE